MRYYHRRHSVYGGYRRRRNPKAILKPVAILLVIAAFVTAIVQSRHAKQAEEKIQALEQQVAALQTQLASGTVSDAPPVQTQDGYQALYPEMLGAGYGQFTEKSAKAVYLTFDDGPSANTNTILDALKARNQKATFFVVGKNISGKEDTLRRIVNEGHTLGIHGYTHDYTATYQSVEAFLEDFHKTYQAVYDACGIYPTIFRFPGGSVNAYNHDTCQQIIAEMTRRGFVYYDWDVSSEDATGQNYTAEQLVETVMQGVLSKQRAVVLMHDAADKKATADAVPVLLDRIISVGCYSDKLDHTVRPVTFRFHE